MTSEPSPSLKLILDRERCAGSGHCIARLPHRFARAEDGRAEVREESLADQELPALRDVVFACRASALRIEGDAFFDFPNVGP